MTNKTAIRLKKNIPTILNVWEENVRSKETNHLGSFALRNSLPEFLGELVEVLSRPTVNSGTNLKNNAISSRMGKKHGNDRAITS